MENFPEVYHDRIAEDLIHQKHVYSTIDSENEESAVNEQLTQPYAAIPPYLHFDTFAVDHPNNNSNITKLAHLTASSSLIVRMNTPSLIKEI